MQLSGMNPHEPGMLLVSMTYTSGVSITQDAEISSQPAAESNRKRFPRVRHIRVAVLACELDVNNGQ